MRENLTYGLMWQGMETRTGWSHGGTLRSNEKPGPCSAYRPNGAIL